MLYIYKLNVYYRKQDIKKWYFNGFIFNHLFRCSRYKSRDMDLKNMLQVFLHVLPSYV